MIARLSRPRVLCLCLSFVFLVYGCLLATKSIAGFPTTHNTHTRWPWLGDKPVGEDGFYMLTVADNLVTTHHLVYNYGLTATGIQPLSTFVFAGVAYVTDHLGGDRWMLIRAVLLLGVVLFILFAWQVAFIAADLAPPASRDLVFLIAFFLTLFDLSAFRLFTYGLETGMYLIAMAGCMQIWLRLNSEPRARWSTIFAFGFVCGIAGLARIDFGLFVVFLLGYLLLKRIASLLQVLTAGLVALLVVSPWFIFVHSVGSGWLPSSGKAESRVFSFAHDMLRIPDAILAVISNVCTWSYADAGTRPTTIFACLSVAAVLFLIWRSRKSLSVFERVRALGLLGAWLPAIVTIILVYVVFFWSRQFYPRYFSPLILLSIPMMAILLATQSFVIRRPALVLLPIACFFCMFDVPSLHGGHVVLDHVISAGYIREYFPNARVASFQSGDLGYFNPNVENLDGKLNQRALAAAKEHHMDDFVDSERIDVLVDWPGFLHQLPAEYLARDWQPCANPMFVDDSICLIRKHPFDTGLASASQP